MRQFQFKGDDETFTLKELFKEVELSDQEFDDLANLEIGDEQKFLDDPACVIVRIQDVKEIQEEVAHGD